MRVVVSFVAVELVGPSAAGTAAAADRRYRHDQRLQRETVMAVGRGDGDRDRKAGPVGDEMDLRSVLAAIGRIRSGQKPPLTARMLTESMAKRDQFSSPRAPSSSRMTRCRRAQTRSLLQRAKRR